MPIDINPPAIIQRAPLVEVRFGLSYAVSRVGYDAVRLPRDYHVATLPELLAWLPRELRDMPPWALQAMFPGIGGSLAGLLGSSGTRSVVFLTSTSTSNQTWSVLSDWNSGDNKLEGISHGGTAGSSGSASSGCEDGDGDGGPGGAGGGGGYFKKLNATLTPPGSATYHNEAAGTDTGTGQATWIGGATLAASLGGIRGASNGGTGGNGGCGGSNGAPGADGAGAVTTNGIGDVLYAGGTSVNGGGAAGPNGPGSGTTSGGGSWTSVPGGAAAQPGNGDAIYGGGGSPTSNLAKAGLIVATNNASQP